MNNVVNDLDQLPGKAQKQILVVPIIDSSRSMNENGNIGKVNDAMREVAPQLATIEQDNEVEILLAPIIFNNGASWVGLDPVGKPSRPENFNWSDITANGGTDLGSAFELLRGKLTTAENGGWMDGRKGLRPVLLLISDGEPTDMWETPLQMLSKRGWFKVAMRFAIAVEGSSMEVLEKFTGNKETIYTTDTLRTDLGSLVKVIVLAASQAVSDAGGATPENTTPTAEDADELEKARINQSINDTVNSVNNGADPTNAINVNNTDDFYDDEAGQP